MAIDTTTAMPRVSAADCRQESPACLIAWTNWDRFAQWKAKDSVLYVEYAGFLIAKARADSKQNQAAADNFDMMRNCAPIECFDTHEMCRAAVSEAKLFIHRQLTVIVEDKMELIQCVQLRAT